MWSERAEKVRTERRLRVLELRAGTFSYSLILRLSRAFAAELTGSREVHVCEV